MTLLPIGLITCQVFGTCPLCYSEDSLPLPPHGLRDSSSSSLFRLGTLLPGTPHWLAGCGGDMGKNEGNEAGAASRVLSHRLWAGVQDVRACSLALPQAFLLGR